jgi:hypothetical protein
MRGHQDLIAMRLAGKVPQLVNLHMGTDPAQQWRDWPTANPWASIAHIEIRDSEPAARADLRCLVGLPVHVHGADEARVLSGCQAALDAGAAGVWGVFTITGKGVAYNKETNEWLDF